jgi:geranylgeranyl reductase
MGKYDVLIVGAGPAGLFSAEHLAGSGLSVLVLEKNDVPGDKICAGGLTEKDLELLPVPEELIEVRMNESVLKAPLVTMRTNHPKPVLFTVDRRRLGAWQAERVRAKGIEVRTSTPVKEIAKDHVVTAGGEKIGYRYLVGADGPTSLVRRFLRLPVEQRIFTLQYRIPWKEKPRFEIHMNARYFHSWYGWLFPHDGELVAGTGGDPRYVSPQWMKKRFHKWLRKNGIDISGAVYESFPISYDYRGWDFDPVFLAGEAAGLASGLTGEGIYQALVSGKVVAEKITGKRDKFPELDQILRYNAIQHKFMKVLIKSGPFRNLILNSILLYLKMNRKMKLKVSKALT